jgi:hypothetical protein
VHHLDEVAGAVRADVRAAGLAVDLRRDVLEQRAEGLVRLLRAAGHDARPVQRALLATGDAAADEVQPSLAQRLLAAARVGEVRVAGVDDHVALFEQRRELLDDGVRRAARLDHDHDLPGPLQRVHELLRGVRRDEVALVAELLHQRAGPLLGPVVQGHRVAVPGQVAGQVAAHDRQAGDPDARLLAHPNPLNVSLDSDTSPIDASREATEEQLT